VGSEEKSKRKEVNSTQHAFSQWLARARDCVKSILVFR
jgi:hypothetical protein